jgi:D-alanyl-D-alanine carboxypeptidase
VLKGGLQSLKYCSALVLAASIALGLSGSGQAARAEGARHAAMVIDANSGKVLHDANADEPRYPASLTKLMTIYLAFEALQQGSLKLDSQLTVSEAAASVAPSKLELKPGETIELADAIKALVTKSANDMAVAIAEKIAGDERSFAELMTKRARQIGMNSTTFRNASGLPVSGQITTARDMLTLALRIYDDFPDKARVFSLREFTYQGKTYRTHNTLMKSFAGMDGMKTGYTSKSGFNLVASVRRDGKHLVAAVFGGATASSRNAHMRQILTQALDDASTEKTRVSKPQLIASVRPATRPQKVEEKPAVKVAAVASPQKPAVKPAAVKAAPTPAAPPATAPVAASPPPATPAPAPVQQVSVTPPDVPAPSVPPQSVTVSPPMIVASVKTIPITPAMPSAPTVAAKQDRVIVDPAVDAAQQSVSVRPPAPLAAGAASKLDFAALRKAIAGPDLAPPSAAIAAPAATAPPRPDETIVAKAAPAEKILPPDAPALGRAPSTLNAQVAMLQPVANSMSSLATPAPIAVARPPSTLAAQAAAQAVPVSAEGPPMRLNGPANAASSPAVQIGAYASQQEAEKRLAETQARAPAVLGSASPFSRRIESGGRQLYAARFGGFDQLAASKACLELRQQSIDCFVVSSK